MNKTNNEEIISRRKFFKKAAGLVIPAVALTVLPSILTSCKIDEPYPGVDTGTGGESCGCGGNCSTRCNAACRDSCVDTCRTKCYSSCKGGCGKGCSYHCGTSLTAKSN